MDAPTYKVKNGKIKDPIRNAARDAHRVWRDNSILTQLSEMRRQREENKLYPSMTALTRELASKPHINITGRSIESIVRKHGMSAELQPSEAMSYAYKPVVIQEAPPKDYHLCAWI